MTAETKPILMRASECFRDVKTYDKGLKVAICVSKIAKHIFNEMEWEAAADLLKAFAGKLAIVKGVINVWRCFTHVEGFKKDPEKDVPVNNMRIASSAFFVASDVAKGVNFSFESLGALAAESLISKGLGVAFGVFKIAGSGVEIGQASYTIHKGKQEKGKWEQLKKDVQAKAERYALVLQELEALKRAPEADAGLIRGKEEECNDTRTAYLKARVADYQIKALEVIEVSCALSLTESILNIAGAVLGIALCIATAGAGLVIAFAVVGACSAAFALFRIWHSTENRQIVPNIPAEIAKTLEKSLEQDWGLHIHLRVEILQQV